MPFILSRTTIMGSFLNCGEPQPPQLRMPASIMFKAPVGLKFGFALDLPDGLKIKTCLENFPIILIGSLTGISANNHSELSVPGFWSVRQ